MMGIGITRPREVRRFRPEPGAGDRRQANGGSGRALSRKAASASDTGARVNRPRARARCIAIGHIGKLGFPAPWSGISASRRAFRGRCPPAPGNARRQPPAEGETDDRALHVAPADRRDPVPGSSATGADIVAGPCDDPVAGRARRRSCHRRRRRWLPVTSYHYGALARRWRTDRAAHTNSGGGRDHSNSLGAPGKSRRSPIHPALPETQARVSVSGIAVTSRS